MGQDALSLDLLRRMADACPLAVIVHRLDDVADDRTVRILYANRATRTQLAIDPEDIVGRLCEEQFPSLREQGYIARLMRVVRTGQAEDYEDYYHTDDRISAVFAGHIERIAEGTTATWFENVTRRKEVEREAARLVEVERESRSRKDALAEIEAAQRKAEDALDIYALSALAADEALWSITLASPGEPVGPATPCRFSDRFAAMIGRDPSEVEHVFATFERFVHPDDAGLLRGAFQRLFDDPASRMSTAHRMVAASGGILYVQTSACAATDGQGRVRRIAGAIHDATAERLVEVELRERVEQIERQRSLIEVLSTPVLELWEDVIALPIVGTLDARRAELTMQVLLQTIHDRRIRFALLDLTGVDTIDTETADHVMRLAHVVRLLGAQAIVTGIRPAVAQTMVALGLDLWSIETRRNLRDALRDCLARVARERVAPVGA